LYQGRARQGEAGPVISFNILPHNNLRRLNTGPGRGFFSSKRISLKKFFAGCPIKTVLLSGEN
ncbi:MAG: hypothetical protein ACKO0V_13585, partial [bacterium]